MGDEVMGGGVGVPTATGAAAPGVPDGAWMICSSCLRIVPELRLSEIDFEHSPHETRVTIDNWYTRVEKELAELERAATLKNRFAAVRSTAFGIVAENKGFRFYVIDQQPVEVRP